MREGILKLGVNVDHVATIRQARGTAYPSPVEAAIRCARAGAHGITIHLREDRRHIQDEDVASMKQKLDLPLNLEMACAEDVVAVALRVRPEEACLVPERREERTTEGGLDAAGQSPRIREIVQRLADAGIRVSLFLEPDARQLDAAVAVGAPVVELHTGRYCNAGAGDAAAELDRLVEAARDAHGRGLQVNAGHGINLDNMAGILEIPHLDTLNIGHSIVARAILVGMENAVKEMLAACGRYQGGRR
jgi:pyridoxine 5-phosphate synthase